MKSFLPRYSSKVINISSLSTTTTTQNLTPLFKFVLDIEPDQNYEVTVTVRNISKRVRRIKFIKPKTNKFRISYDQYGSVAAGLAVKLNVSFETDVDGDFHDVIEIGCEDSKETYKLLIHATRPSADI